MVLTAEGRALKVIGNNFVKFESFMRDYDP
jgi:hypothetical protein